MNIEEKKLKAAARARAWHEKNKQRAYETHKAYYENNRETELQKQKVYSSKNKARTHAYYKQYYKTNKHVYIANNHKRRAIAKGLNEQFTPKDIQLVKERFNHKCVICGAEGTHVDHWKPLSKGHVLTHQNATLMCNICNSKKGTRLPRELYPSELCDIIESHFPCLNKESQAEKV